MTLRIVPYLAIAYLLVGLEAYSEGREHYLETHHYRISGDAAFRKNAADSARGRKAPALFRSTSPTNPRMSEKERIAWLNSPFNY